MKRIFVAVAVLLGLGGTALAAEINVARPTAENPLTVLMLAGTLESGDAARFEQLASNAPTAMVFLNSDGGALDEGLRIGEFVNSHHYTTAVVETRCASACALIWVAGSTRIVSPRAQIGFHSAYRLEDNTESGQANALVGAYLTRLGYDYDAVAYMTQARPAGMQWLSYADAARLRMILNEATPELVTLFNGTTMGREGTPPAAPISPRSVAELPRTPEPPPGPPVVSSAISGSFPLVPNGIQGTLERIVAQDTARAYATGRISEADIRAYCRVSIDTAACEQRYLITIDAPISAAANCGTRTAVYYFRHVERAGMDLSTGKVVTKGGFNEQDSRGMLVAQFKWLCPNSARIAGLGG